MGKWTHRLLIGMIGISLLLGTGVAWALEVGDKAPDFELPSTTGETISLSQFKGKKHVLLQFYTLEFNPT
jgi:hypothetical protein